MLPGELRRPYLPEYGNKEARLEAMREKNERGYEPDSTGKPFNWKEAQKKKANLTKSSELEPMSPIKPIGEPRKPKESDYLDQPLKGGDRCPHCNSTLPIENMSGNCPNCQLDISQRISNPQFGPNQKGKEKNLQQEIIVVPNTQLASSDMDLVEAKKEKKPTFDEVILDEEEDGADTTYISEDFEQMKMMLSDDEVDFKNLPADKIKECRIAWDSLGGD